MDFAQQQRNPVRHLAGIAFVIILHVFVVWALVTGLAQKVVEVVKAPIETKLIQEFKKPPPPETPPPPPPKFAAPPPPFIPPPEVNIAVPPPVANTITAVTSKPQPPTPIAVTAPTHQRTSAVIDAKRGCDEPEYPSASRRAEETGTVTLRFLIDVDGRVVDSKIETSSGFPRLDRAARDALSRCTFKAGTVDGKPEQSWASIRYTWRLQ